MYGSKILFNFLLKFFIGNDSVQNGYSKNLLNYAITIAGNTFHIVSVSTLKYLGLHPHWPAAVPSIGWSGSEPVESTSFTKHVDHHSNASTSTVVTQQSKYNISFFFHITFGELCHFSEIFFSCCTPLDTVDRPNVSTA